MQLNKELDKNLLHLAWSLWTELGVAGVKQNHQNVLILVEELIIFTSVLSEMDPRLRDESMDWCSQFHHFVSVSRLKSLMKNFKGLAEEPFSKYASSLNRLSKINWPIFTESIELNVHLSGKSVLRPQASAALLNIRARSLFGTGARADLLTFFLVRPEINFSIAEAAEIGYSKRNLAEVLDDLYFIRLFDLSMQGNQKRYSLNKDNPLFKILQPMPGNAPSWHLIFKVLLTLRSCFRRIENYSESTQVVELRNCFKEQAKLFQKLKLIPPPFLQNFENYLKNVSQWVLEWTDSLANGQSF
ncbi:MAG TPA: hypothetical protein DCE71_01350 [Parachlamydiales bacterium]|nr:hypothetical protein [Parachlamydiales bacterium]